MMERILVFLLKRNAHRTPTQISTTELGKMLDMSQQNASRLLILLEKTAKIKRRGWEIKITSAGVRWIQERYLELKKALETENEQLLFDGKIVSGLGEGSYYISKYAKKIKAALGFVPFFGTLNIKLDEKSIDKRVQLLEVDPVTIKGFVYKNRSFGDIFAYRCVVAGIKGAAIIPVRTHHGTDILEIVSDKNLLIACNKKIGDRVRITIYRTE